MKAPERFGHEDVAWRPSVEDDPQEVIAIYLQHRVVMEVRRQDEQASVRDMAERAGVGKSTMARWLAGQELLNMSGLAALAVSFGVEVLDGLGGMEERNTAALLPAPYRPLAMVRSGNLAFADVSEPSWSELAVALTDAIEAEHHRRRGHLLSSPALAWMLACAAEELPPTRGLVDVGESDGTIVFALEEPITVTVARVADDTAGRVRIGILFALMSAPVIAPRRVVALVLGTRGATVLDHLGRSRADGQLTIGSVTLARAGIGDPVGPDLVVTVRGRATAGAGTVVLLELLKSPVSS